MESTVDNIMYVFDDTQVGTIAFRELLIMFCVSMNSEIEEKLNWTFRYIILSNFFFFFAWRVITCDYRVAFCKALPTARGGGL